eukprot:CAMPEP_0177518690 /NCGR_PEP_ID=MMETSP0369-20130122/46667_1 /TAXON_ID=447022 ORGANISM="Scrippsiella hangoei-like, Strain SHHI-4" /NCGR_SAMPLE_ID=MMETSP0369 /ASSEMBLY_ACC=CAM_ASM_000364 /LENGTH=396 /DNA_ID=CAMNT_0018997829 /DNA_START=37 /DNA_END=1227 /DNA_ORIENTATION=+
MVPRWWASRMSIRRHSHFGFRGMGRLHECLMVCSSLIFLRSTCAPHRRAFIGTLPALPARLLLGRAPWRASHRRPVVGCLHAVPLTLDVLARQDSATVRAVFDVLASDASFEAFTARQMQSIVRRDEEDGEKLKQGIQLAIDKGLLPEQVHVESARSVNVEGREVDDICSEIIEALGDAPQKGCVMTLQGLSGTGKGTVVTRLQQLLPNTHIWSNGNLFRAVTLLATTLAEQQGINLQEALRPTTLQTLMGMLKLVELADGEFDLKVDGLCLSYLASEVKNTVLKESRIERSIPTVAGMTQGEVINFVRNALEQMTSSGYNVLMEGREQTLNYIRTPHRFEVILPNMALIGQRRAAQLVGARALDQIRCKGGGGEPGSEVDVHAEIREALKALVGT